MEIQWPWSAALFVLLPLLVLVYVLVLRRRKPKALPYSSLSLLREFAPQPSRWKRHLPFAMLLLALASLVSAMMRPTANVVVPVGRTAVILAIDVSLSMCTTDIPPNRLEAAKDAALAFLERQDPNVQVGVVAFAGFAVLIQEPTNDQGLLRGAVESMQPARRTAIGSAIVESLDAIAELDDRVPPVLADFSSPEAGETVAEGEFVPHIVVLLTDGVTTSGLMPLDAAAMAAERGVRIFPIGFGTDNENAPFGGPGCGDLPFFFGGSGFGGSGFGGGGGGFTRAIDETTLIQIAEMTGGNYYAARSAGELQEVFQDLPTFLVTEVQRTEVSVYFVALGALMAALAAILGVRWRVLP